MFDLRYYQKLAVHAVYDHLKTRKDNPCVVIPTGGGKSVIIAKMCQDVMKWNAHVLVVTHVKELVQQNHEKIVSFNEGLFPSIYCASLKSKNYESKIVCASIQSIFRKANTLGKFDLVIIDEAHLLPPDGEGMYRSYLADAHAINPKLRVVGLTATPYRMDSGMICGPDNTLNHICYEVGIKELIAHGFLSKLTTKEPTAQAKTNLWRVERGEFTVDSIDRSFTPDILHRAVKEIVTMTENRTAVLIFAGSIAHGRAICKELETLGKDACFVSSESPSGWRDEVVSDFKNRKNKYLVNVNIFTTGFDAPHLDAIAIVRPTQSPGLFYQMVGRGLRTSPGKETCLVLDYGENIKRHGPIDAIRPISRQGGQGGVPPTKTCPTCREMIHAALRVCTACGYEFPDREVSHNPYAAKGNITSGEATEWNVDYISYEYHKKPTGTYPSMKVTYDIGKDNVREWVCFEHDGFARKKAELWWRSRSGFPIPRTVNDAIEACINGQVAKASKVWIVQEGNFDRIVKYELGEVPQPEAGYDFLEGLT